jgi:hypothetical protein
MVSSAAEQSLAFSQWLQQQEAKAGGTFTSFYLTPVQRVPRCVCLRVPSKGPRKEGHKPWTLRRLHIHTVLCIHEEKNHQVIPYDDKRGGVRGHISFQPSEVYLFNIATRIFFFRDCRRYILLLKELQKKIDDSDPIHKELDTVGAG